LPLVVDFRDGLLFEPLEVRLLKKVCFQKHYMDVEKQLVGSADLIITISQPITNYFLQKYGCSGLLTLPNGFDDVGPIEPIKHEWDKDIIHIVHTGRIDSSRESLPTSKLAIASLGEALEILYRWSPNLLSKMRIHFVGNLVANERAVLSSFVELGLVILWGHQPRSVALGFQRKAEYLLLVTATDQASLATGKIFEYLAADKVILALTRGTEAERIIRETGAGVVIPPDDPIKIAEWLLFIVDGNQLNCSRNQQVIDSYYRSIQMKILAAHLKGLVN
jgi:glycosyltransferase involved in cell wall biosynthesis